MAKRQNRCLFTQPVSKDSACAKPGSVSSTGEKLLGNFKRYGIFEQFFLVFNTGPIVAISLLRRCL